APRHLLLGRPGTRPPRMFVSLPRRGNGPPRHGSPPRRRGRRLLASAGGPPDRDHRTAGSVGLSRGPRRPAHPKRTAGRLADARSWTRLAVPPAGSDAPPGRLPRAFAGAHPHVGPRPAARPPRPAHGRVRGRPPPPARRGGPRGGPPPRARPR